MKVLLVLALFWINVGAGTPTMQNKEALTPTGIAESFLARLGKGEVEPAYQQLFAGSPLAAQPTQLQMLKSQTESALSIFGKALGFELYKQEKFGESLVRLTYVQRLERHPLVWKFWVYRPGSEWQVNAVVFNDQFNFE